MVVQDAFPAETTELADVVLPVALWGEKTVTFTNIDRTVHISHKAVEPPGEARPDLDILLDYARRMDVRDEDGAPLVKWTDPEGAFEAWIACSRGRPCDYTGLSYQKLTGGSGIPWPCNEEHPEGSPRIYTDHQFPTAFEACESYGHDLVTEAAVTPETYKAIDPRGKAFLKPADYEPPHEEPDEAYPLWLTTGRVVHHFHTRTKTGRAPELEEVAPEGRVQVSPGDAEALGLAKGDWVRIESRRGRIEVRAEVGEIEPGRVFVPFHSGYWDDPERVRAANELIVFEWDAVSKQPHFKHAAVRLQRIEAPSANEPDQQKNSSLKDAARHLHEVAAETLKPSRRHVREYLGLIEGGERALAGALETVAAAHRREPDIVSERHVLATWSRRELQALRELIARYGEAREAEPDRLGKAVSPQLKATGPGLVRDLHDCWLLAQETHMSLVVLDQAAKGLRGEEMKGLVERVDHQNRHQREWLLTRIKQAAPQALVTPS